MGSNSKRYVSRRAVEKTAQQALEQQRRIGNTSITYERIYRDAADAARRSNNARNKG
jgi:hypothetical protein